ncbi:hypothetical protein AALP_AA2G173200 [Arabis alpina]|uniref:MATH domain-containing protein n=1 Tax=Arabis alpina TaxID=50452 RepID=A0A087HI44_ARAAL|nr:hypothetical protein AALP_AA2G173200 [Arabis alpina]
MFTEEKKKRNYGSIFVYCFFCFVFVVEVARFAKPYYNLENLMETEAVVEERLLDVVNSEILPCHFLSSRSASVPATKDQKLKGPIIIYRDRPPTSYCVKFESFANMSNLIKDGKYESRPFSLGGYNWTFVIYPNGNKPDAAAGYVSVYAKIDNSSLIANPKDVYAEIKFFVYRRTLDQYYMYQETEAQRFHLFKPQWGLPNFLPISYFNDPGLGFIFDGGQSVFGIDIFVAQPFDKWEVFSYEQNIRDPLFAWRLTNFSIRYLDFYSSGSFSSGGRNWELKVYPNGVGIGMGNSLSLYLVSASGERGYVKAKLRVIGTTNVEKQVEGSPNAVENGWGFDKFMPLADIRDTSKGFLVNDALKIEVEILSFSKTDNI